MKSLEINLSRYGHNLGSRMLGKKVFSDIKHDFLLTEELVLDFSNVDRITLSFGTELIDSISSFGISIKVKNCNSSVGKLLAFCLNNIKCREELV